MRRGNNYSGARRLFRRRPPSEAAGTIQPQLGLIATSRVEGMSESRKVLKVLALAGRHPAPTEHDGQYVVEFDPDGGWGGGMLLRTSDDRYAARTFAHAGEAMDYWQARSKGRPTRDDGKPNRPLTAYHVLIENAPRPRSGE